MTDFIRIASNPVPAGAEATQFENEGAKLRAAFFPADNARGHVVLMTGWAEFIEKYFETVEDLRAREFSVAMMDWRGQGRSDRASPAATGWRGYFDQIVEDLRLFAEAYAAPRFSGPAILMTHSMGGLPALKLLATGYDHFERAVLCAPMTQLFKGAENAIIQNVSGVACAFGAATRNAPRGKDSSETFDGNIFTSDKRRHDMFRLLKEAEPAAGNTGPTFGWINAALKASAEIHKDSFFRNLKTPTRIISAGAEKQVNGADHAVIADASDLIDLVTIPDALHEILMERDEIRAQYWEAFDEFVEPAIS